MLCSCFKSTQRWSNLCIQLNFFRRETHSWSTLRRFFGSWTDYNFSIISATVSQSRTLEMHVGGPLARKSVHDSIFIASPIKKCFSTTRQMLARLKPEEVRKRVDKLTDHFAEARELLGDARESLGTTYFSDDMSEAQESVSSTLSLYEALLSDLEKDQREDVIRTIGLRMEELKAQEQAIKDLLD